MITLGVDVASQLTSTVLCTISWDGTVVMDVPTLSASDDVLARMIESSDNVLTGTSGIETPFRPRRTRGDSFGLRGYHASFCWLSESATCVVARNTPRATVRCSLVKHGARIARG